jgi:hypothetical protein
MRSPIHPVLFWLSNIATAAVLVWWARRYFRAVRDRPRFEASKIIFQEWCASGCSQKNIITKLGGARNCLRLVVTKQFLWVTSWFPFSLIAPFYDMEHVIPLDAIVSVRHSRFVGRSTLLLTYRDSSGESHTLRLLPRKQNDFIMSLGVKAENETSP